MRFWDASAILPILLREARSPVVRDVWQADPGLAVWWGTQVECGAALARLRREGVLSGSEEASSWRDLDDLLEGAVEVAAGARVRESALRMVRVHPLRAADGLQLAAAVAWAEEAPAGHDLVSLDQRLREAGAREGFRVLP